MQGLGLCGGLEGQGGAGRKKATVVPTLSFLRSERLPASELSCTPNSNNPISLDANPPPSEITLNQHRLLPHLLSQFLQQSKHSLETSCLQILKPPRESQAAWAPSHMNPSPRGIDVTSPRNPYDFIFYLIFISPHTF